MWPVRKTFLTTYDQAWKITQMFNQEMNSGRVKVVYGCHQWTAEASEILINTMTQKIASFRKDVLLQVYPKITVVLWGLGQKIGNLNTEIFLQIQMWVWKNHFHKNKNLLKKLEKVKKDFLKRIKNSCFFSAFLN